MTEDLLRYDKMVEKALRDVVRQALIGAAQDGLPGEHHFYISFSTQYPGVKIPDYLFKQYPDEMTIVLQYQFSDLKIEEEHFSVFLSFNNVREKLTIPFQAITTFADPSVNFALQFQSIGSDDDDDGEETPDDGSEAEGGEKPAKDEKRGEVISLDMFRKKP
ncbi:MAG: ClpXP protease specificity-enhancing factor SspB [Alphaproteobacteria bacterium]